MPDFHCLVDAVGGYPSYVTGNDADSRMLGPWPAAMDNPIRNYAWGSTTVLAQMQDRTPSGEPEAELWLGAHPDDPSTLHRPDGHAITLDHAIETSPQELLGADVVLTFGAQLPYLMKLMAVNECLSIQVHPSQDRAHDVHHDPGKGLGGHTYGDPHPKPELLYALEPFDMLCAFRENADSARLIELLDVPRLSELAAPLFETGDSDSAADDEGADDPGADDAMHQAFSALLTLGRDEAGALVPELVTAARRLLRSAPLELSGADRRSLMWLLRVARQYPDDPMVAAPVMMQVVHLEPGEVVYIPAGTPHAYLYGLGVEISANSDNVLRAGLTPKQIAIDELLHVLDTDSRPQREVPYIWLSPYEIAWAPPTSFFQISRIWAHTSAPVPVYDRLTGPHIFLCTSGPVTISSGETRVELHAGQSAFVGACAGNIEISGPGEVFRASAGTQPYPIQPEYIDAQTELDGSQDQVAAHEASDQESDDRETEFVETEVAGTEVAGTDDAALSAADDNWAFTPEAPTDMPPPAPQLSPEKTEDPGESEEVEEPTELEESPVVPNNSGQDVTRWQTAPIAQDKQWWSPRHDT